MWVTLTVNGGLVERDVHPGTTLLELLREDLRLTGTKEGCGKGECGACTVILDGEPALACLVLAATLDGAQVTTIEGLSRSGPGGELHPVQRALVAEGGVQCGFCTPGVALAAAHLVDRCRVRGLAPSRPEIDEALEGNLCRCTGYRKIVAAVERAAGKVAEPC
jgi:aerobic carbon-monoxide dehydrogenase small subunit